MEAPSRRRLAVALLLLAATATVTVLDPHRAVGGAEPSYVVGPDISPSATWEHARLNSLGVPVRVTVRTTPGPGNDTLVRKWVHEYDPSTRRYYGALFFPDDDPGVWSTSRLYVGETVEATLLGDVSEPVVSARPDDATTDVRPTYGAAPSGIPLGSLDADELRLLGANRTTVVIGVRGADPYADLHDVDERLVREESAYRVHVDRDSGRLRRIVDHRVLNRSGETERAHRVYEFAYRNVSVARPAWAPWHPVELAYDALSV